MEEPPLVEELLELELELLLELEELDEDDDGELLGALGALGCEGLVGWDGQAVSNRIIVAPVVSRIQNSV